MGKIDLSTILSPRPGLDRDEGKGKGPFDRMERTATGLFAQVLGRLEDIREAVEGTNVPRESVRRRLRLSPQTNSSGVLATVTIEIEGPPAGREWLLERIAFSCSGGGTPDLSVYQNAIQDGELIGYMVDATKGIEDPSNPILIAQGVRSIFFVFGSVAIGGITQGNIQVKEFSIEPAPARHP